MKIKEIIKPALILFIICLVTSVALAGTNLLTEGKIEQQEIDNAAKARHEVLPSADSFEEKDGYAIGRNSSGGIEGYIFTATSKGYGGDIKVMVGVLESGEIGGVTILDHSETPGLGANTSKPTFYNQYAGLSALENVNVTKSIPSKNEVAAVTGATISSRAVTAAVNEALNMYRQIKKGA